MISGLGKWPQITYQDVSEFLEEKMKYYMMDLKQHGKLIGKKQRIIKSENKKHQYKTAIE